MSNVTAKKTAGNFIWKFLENCGSHLVTFIVGIVLARLLDPTDYGAIAIVTVFIEISLVFIDSGLATSLVQKKDADNVDYSTMFYFNIASSTILYLIVFFTAPMISDFYEMPELVSVFRVLGLTLIIAGVRNIQNVYLAKTMRFRFSFWATLISTIISAIIGIGMAYGGYGVWALVGQQVSKQLLSAIVLWITVKWRPILAFSWKRFRGLFSYGWKLLASSLLNTGYNSMRSLIIGKKYTADDLAYYTKSSSMPDFVLKNVDSSISAVLFPAISVAQDNPNMVKSMTRRSIKTSSYIMAPLMVGLAVCARPLIILLLTEKWLGCVLFMQIFCITYLFYPIHTANLSAIKAMGRSDYFLALEIVKKIVGITAILITMWISVEAMAYSLLVTTLLNSIINSFPNKKLLNYSWVEQIKDILPYIGLAALMGIPVFLIGYLSLPTIVVLILQVITGGIIYIGLSAIFKLEIFIYLLNIAKGFLKKKEKKINE